MKYKRATFIAAFLLAAACFVLYYAACRDTWDTTDPIRVLNQAQSLECEGQHGKALARFQWVRDWYFRNDHPIKPSDFELHEQAVRCWGELSKVYPKARETLITVRDVDEKELEQYKSVSLWTEVLIINHYLQQENRSVNLFKAVHHNYPHLAAEYYWFTEQDLVKAREYQVCATYVPDSTAAFRKISDYRNDELRAARASTSAQETTRARMHAETAFTERVARLVEILAGSGRLDEAKEIKKKALAVQDNPTLRENLEEAFDRASKPK
jgi:hypothetical protein